MFTDRFGGLFLCPFNEWSYTRGKKESRVNQPQPVDETAEMYIDIAAILDGAYPLYLKAAAKHLSSRESGTVRVGQYLQALDATLLDELLDVGIKASENDTDAALYLTLLSVMLANAEALTVSMTENLGELQRRLLLLVQIEMYRRAGRIDFDPRWLSLGSLEPAGLQLTRSDGKLRLSTLRRNG